MDRIYVTEDSRSQYNDYNCTSVSAIMALDEKRYLQYCAHNRGAPYKQYDEIEQVSRIYTRQYGHSGDLGVIHREWEDTNSIRTPQINVLKDYLKNGIWRWYFENT